MARVVMDQAASIKVPGSGMCVIRGADSINGCGDCCWESHGVLTPLLVVVVFCHSGSHGFLPYLVACHMLNLLVGPWPRSGWQNI